MPCVSAFDARGRVLSVGVRRYLHPSPASFTSERSAQHKSPYHSPSLFYLRSTTTMLLLQMPIYIPLLMSPYYYWPGFTAPLFFISSYVVLYIHIGPFPRAGSFGPPGFLGPGEERGKGHFFLGTSSPELPMLETHKWVEVCIYTSSCVR